MDDCAAPQTVAAAWTSVGTRDPGTYRVRVVTISAGLHSVLPDAIALVKGMLADVGGEHLDDLRVVLLGVAGDTFERVNAAEAHVKRALAELG